MSKAATRVNLIIVRVKKKMKNVVLVEENWEE